MDKVGLEVAEKEFKKWAEFKKIRGSKLEANEEHQDIIIDEIVEGNIFLTENYEFNYTLKFPITDSSGNEALSFLIFKPRVSVRDINSKMQGVKSTDGDARLLAYVAAITNQNSKLLNKLDLSDYSVCQAIIMYFL